MSRAAPSATSLCVSHVVELAGPPGAGKSSVFSSLVARTDNVVIAPILRTRPYTRVLATNVPPVLATLVRHAAVRGLTSDKLRSMLYLRALPGLIDRSPAPDANVLVFDQGPLYLMTEAQLRDGRLVVWRHKTLETWAALLDLVVWLDAPDAVLTERIDTRHKLHRLRGEGLETTSRALAEARTAYSALISSLEARERRPRILRFDTSRMSPEDVVDVLLERVDAFTHGIRSDTADDDVAVRGVLP